MIDEYYIVDSINEKELFNQVMNPKSQREQYRHVVFYPNQYENLNNVI